jgi:hypothetical protein
MFLDSKQEEPPKKRGERRWERHHVKIRASLRLSRNGIEHFLVGTCYDIAEGGTRLFLASELHDGEEITLKLTLPYSEAVEVKGVVRNRVRYEYGIEFVVISEAARQSIERNCKALALLQ